MEKLHRVQAFWRVEGSWVIRVVMSHPLFEVVTTTAGAVSIRNKVVNEIMHNPVGPWVEANALYIEQSKLKERLQKTSTEPYVIFDVGLGAAANAIAALACFRSLGASSRPVHLVSFEKDMELLRFALEHAAEFPHFQGFEPALKSILENGEWEEPGLLWELREGDFLDCLPRETSRAHLVFFDPYSPKVNSEMWGSKTFTLLRKFCRDKSEGGCQLYTYSQATRIRVALIEAGFHVGQGSATGLKEETTQAATSLDELISPLSQRWFQRWERSHVRHPFDAVTLEEQKRSDELIHQYMQRNFPYP